MIRRAATWTSTEEAQQKNARNSRDLGGRNDIPCSLNMDVSIGLRANFTIDAGAMGDGTTSADGLRERSRIREIGRDDRGRRRMTPVTAPGKEDGLMAEGNQVLREVAPNETSSARFTAVAWRPRLGRDRCFSARRSRQDRRTLGCLADSAADGSQQEHHVLILREGLVTHKFPRRGEFLERTPDDHFRHSRVIGLRED